MVAGGRGVGAVAVVGGGGGSQDGCRDAGEWRSGRANRERG